jgi:glycosyltransferase involved in cell wall biosynthesis
MSEVLLASFDRVPSAKGAARHILQNCAILRDAGHAVSLVSLGDEPMVGVRHLPIAIAEPNYLRRALAFHERVRDVLDRYRFDVHHVRSPWEGLAVPYGAKLLYEVNGLPSIETSYHHPALHARPELRAKLRRMELALLDRASIVTTPSEATARLLAELGVEPDRVRVVPNAPVVPIAGAPPSMREGPTRFCYVGTLASWQGLSAALRALSRVPEPLEVHVRTPSSARHVRALLRLADKLGMGQRVFVAPPVEPDALGAWLASNDVALAPLVPCERNLVQGGMPIKLLDAMAAGLPVVAPALPIVTAVLGHDVPTYRPHSAADLTALASHYARSPEARARDGAANLARVAARFRPERQRDALLAAYRAIAA